MKFTLRDWNISDTESVAKYANNPKIAANLRNGFPNPYTMADAKSYIKGCIFEDKTKRRSFAIDVDGEAVGSIGVFLEDDVYCKTAEVGYWLGEPFWGKGIVTEAVRRICKYAFENYDIVRIYAEPYAYNTASRTVLENAGFELESILKQNVFKNGVIHDSCMYALLRDSEKR